VTGGNLRPSSGRSGSQIYASGSNAEAARLSGARVQLVKLTTFVISGGAAALGAAGPPAVAPSRAACLRICHHKENGRARFARLGWTGETNAMV